jgi:hypothetical protein
MNGNGERERETTDPPTHLLLEVKCREGVVFGHI